MVSSTRYTKYYDIFKCTNHITIPSSSKHEHLPSGSVGNYENLVCLDESKRESSTVALIWTNEELKCDGISCWTWTFFKMYTWRCFLAIIFVLVWYFSEFGQIWTQAFFCFLCFFNFPFKKQDRDRSTQTDDKLEEAIHQVTISDY